MFEYPTTQAPDKERAIPPPLGKTGASWRGFGDLHSGSEIRVDGELFCKDGEFVI